MQAAEAVVSDDGVPTEALFEQVAALIRKSMVASVPGTRPPTFRLMETTRALMAEKLADTPEASSIPRRHAAYILETLRRIVDEFQTVPDSIWLKSCGPLLPDLRAALDWATGEDPELAIALAGVSWPIWCEMSLQSEGRQRLDTIAKLVSPQTPLDLRLRVQRALAELCLHTDSISFAYDSLSEVVSLYRGLKRNPEFGSALRELAFSASLLGHTEEARSYITEAIDLLQQSGRPRELAKALGILMVIQFIHGEYIEAKETGTKAIRLCAMVGANRTALAVSTNLLEGALLAGELCEAVAEGNNIAMQHRSKSYPDLLGYVLGLVSCALLFQRKPEEAYPLLREAATILRDEGMMFWLYDKLALRLALIGRHSDAAVVAGFAIGNFERGGRFREPLAVRIREMLYSVLRSAMSEDVLKQLVESGKYLTEERARSLALDY
jgi:tetratricopeptide (TPR) repeat protein